MEGSGDVQGMSILVQVLIMFGGVILTAFATALVTLGFLKGKMSMICESCARAHVRIDDHVDGHCENCPGTKARR